MGNANRIILSNIPPVIKVSHPFSHVGCAVISVRLVLVLTCFLSLCLYSFRFSKPAPMFLDPNFKRLSKISIYPPPFGVKTQEKIIDHILSATKSYSLGSELDSLSCKKCIIIGNGGILYNKSLGSKIDQYDVVVRLNEAPVAGFEKDVGSKTTMRITYPEGAIQKPERYEKSSLFVFSAFKPMDFKWLRHMVFKDKLVTLKKGTGKLHPTFHSSEPPLNGRDPVSAPQQNMNDVSNAGHIYTPMSRSVSGSSVTGIRETLHTKALCNVGGGSCHGVIDTGSSLPLWLCLRFLFFMGLLNGPSPLHGAGYCVHLSLPEPRHIFHLCVYDSRPRTMDGFWKSVARVVPRDPEDMRILNPYFIQEAAFKFIGLPHNKGLMGRGNIPTLGTVAITMALHNCDEVAVAGFGYDMNSLHAPLHYYEKLKMSAIKESWTHNISKEKEFLQKLVMGGVIQDLTNGI
ncbi:CMP-N-acetylneuraminate-beta-1,4-galactoside alpha-2,3-sialyltransferase [Anabarilius grahami]|uniref:CMP-N-acetylneuraminate-beta-1,4-galactoside alpha-2,3-sialyltransferase n=1 Tax=Anabarilius grahami TaxID=495550 RepID=A0A3N0Y6A0_ANAGA|nr:CMP-N-acetylneuraminate-beta-1,4-galactoside alpha-2,3-sialyltransferase [Anabarilius grahami]